jgi:hypothetical protein
MNQTRGYTVEIDAVRRLAYINMLPADLPIAERLVNFTAIGRRCSVEIVDGIGRLTVQLSDLGKVLSLLTLGFNQEQWPRIGANDAQIQVSPRN